ncbi:hypothetical protein BC938DRAFT_477927 [Jimgerdemannia flammicorona]|uniref:Uncharacterized protein n=1 Tax=Jimgerdemannia flammicorona TaxID=994334 RepID=A0A433QYP7_9FUNG|nr:hypothetical protein BC938DRAFT_477927 [Jimgerdemannia flammicorona]
MLASSRLLERRGQRYRRNNGACDLVGLLPGVNGTSTEADLGLIGVLSAAVSLCHYCSCFVL